MTQFSLFFNNNNKKKTMSINWCSILCTLWEAMKSVFGNLVKVKVEVSTAKLCTNLAHKIYLFFVYFIFFGIMHKLKPLVYNDFQFKIY
jgi:hypothetical protein